MASKSSVLLLLSIFLIAQLLFAPSLLVAAARDPAGHALKKQVPAIAAVLGEAIPDQCVTCIHGKLCCDRSFPTCCAHGSLCCRVAFSCCGGTHCC